MMEARMTKPKQSYVFDRKLSDEELHELIENYEYTPDMDEFSDWLYEVCAEADAEMAEDEARRTKQQIPA